MWLNDLYPTSVAIIGVSHLLQPPLTRLLAKRMALASAFAGLPPLPGAIATNMALASIAMPTTLGLWLAYHAALAFQPGPVRQLAVLLGLFWCWRLYRQLFALPQVWGPAHRGWIPGLAVIFVVQGPVLLAVIALGSFR